MLAELPGPSKMLTLGGVAGSGVSIRNHSTSPQRAGGTQCHISLLIWLILLWSPGPHRAYHGSPGEQGAGVGNV